MNRGPEILGQYMHSMTIIRKSLRTREPHLQYVS